MSKNANVLTAQITWAAVCDLSRYLASARHEGFPEHLEFREGLVYMDEAASGEGHFVRLVNGEEGRNLNLPGGSHSLPSFEAHYQGYEQGRVSELRWSHQSGATTTVTRDEAGRWVARFQGSQLSWRYLGFGWRTWPEAHQLRCFVGVVDLDTIKIVALPNKEEVVRCLQEQASPSIKQACQRLLARLAS